MPQRATDERSRWPESVFTFPESVFNLPGMRVHLRPESVFKIVRNTHRDRIQGQGCRFEGATFCTGSVSGGAGPVLRTQLKYGPGGYLEDGQP